MSSSETSTRDRILDATWTLLAKEPAHAVRMADIAKRSGVSRQAVYLHFENRTELLVATVRHMDAALDVEGRFAPVRDAATGPAKLDAFITAWGNYIPEIHPVARAFLAWRGQDEAADTAWHDRMAAVADGCAKVIALLAQDKALNPRWPESEAAEFLCGLMSVEMWDYLTGTCGWSQDTYLDHIRYTTTQSLVRP